LLAASRVNNPYLYLGRYTKQTLVGVVTPFCPALTTKWNKGILSSSESSPGFGDSTLFDEVTFLDIEVELDVVGLPLPATLLGFVEFAEGSFIFQSTNDILGNGTVEEEVDVDREECIFSFFSFLSFDDFLVEVDDKVLLVDGLVTLCKFEADCVEIGAVGVGVGIVEAELVGTMGVIRIVIGEEVLVVVEACVDGDLLSKLVVDGGVLAVFEDPKLAVFEEGKFEGETEATSGSNEDRLT